MENGFLYITNYSSQFKKLIISIAKKAKEDSGLKDMSGLGIFLFGSPSRQEMVEESDADIMIIRENDDEKYLEFKKNFISLLKKEQFPKIDVPDWGNLAECEIYLRDSITEGNQVIEAKFIFGDSEIEKKVIKLKDAYCNQDKFERIICFQKLYFDQYYKQRTREGIKNVKYGHGGTRDFMFITWFSNLLDIVENKKINFEDNFPHIYKSLSLIYARQLINFEEYCNFCKSADIVILLRNQILINNKGTDSEGLTYLDEKTIEGLHKKGFFKNSFQSQEELRKFLEKSIRDIENLKNCVWKNYLDHLRKSRGFEWHVNFNRLLNGEINTDTLSNIAEEDVISKMAVVWNLSLEKHRELFKKIFEDYSDSKHWEVLASICCHSECPPEVLDKIVIKKAMQKGYEYLLRIISRNKQVQRETLLKIIDNPHLEERFKIVAQTSYNKGVNKANESR